MIYQSFMRIYTRRGDGGLTGIHGGHRVPKTDIRIEANGALDELNSIIGVVRSLLEDESKDAVLRAVQENLMNLMSRVATLSDERKMNTRQLTAGAVEELERELNRISDKGCMTQDFVLPGGCRVAAMLHHARAVCRRAERELWRLNEVDPVESEMMSYVNRLSDLLFAMARECNFDEEVCDERWKRFGDKS